MTNINIPFFLILTITILQIADVYLTNLGLALGLKELNPLYNEFCSITKIVLPLLSYLVYSFLRKFITEKEKIYADAAFITVWLIVLVFYITVISWNLMQLTKVLKNGVYSPKTV